MTICKTQLTRASGSSFFAAGIVFLSVGAGGQPAFIGVGCAFLGLAIAQFVQARRGGRGE